MIVYVYVCLNSFCLHRRIVVVHRLKLLLNVHRKMRRNLDMELVGAANNSFWRYILDIFWSFFMLLSSVMFSMTKGYQGNPRDIPGFVWSTMILQWRMVPQGGKLEAFCSNKRNIWQYLTIYDQFWTIMNIYEYTYNIYEYKWHYMTSCNTYGIDIYKMGPKPATGRGPITPPKRGETLFSLP